MNEILQYWYLIIGIIIISILLLYKERSNKLNRKNKADIQIIVYIVLFIMSVTYIQKTFFSEHLYFIAGFFIFIPVLTLFIFYILSKNNVILIESRIQGEKFYEMGIIPKSSGIKEKLITNSGMLVHILDREFYDSLEYFGNPSSPFKNVGDKVKFCDYFNGEMVYCPENPLLSNITFPANQMTWITFKKVIPDIMNQNLVLTDLVDYKIQYHLTEMRDNFTHALIGTSEQYKHKPLDLEKSIEEKIKEIMLEHRKTLSEKAEKPIEQLKPVKVNKGDNNV